MACVFAPSTKCTPGASACKKFCLNGVLYFSPVPSRNSVFVTLFILCLAGPIYFSSLPLLTPPSLLGSTSPIILGA